MNKSARVAIALVFVFAHTHQVSSAGPLGSLLRSIKSSASICPSTPATCCDPCSSDEPANECTDTWDACDPCSAEPALHGCNSAPCEASDCGDGCSTGDCDGQSAHGVIEGEVVVDEVVGDVMHDSAPAIIAPTPAGSGTRDTGSGTRDHGSATKSGSATKPGSGTKEETTPLEPAPVVPTPVAPKPADDLFAAEPLPPAQPSPQPEPQPEPVNDDDLFGDPEPAAEPAAEPVTDDLFSEQAPTAAPANNDDLFGESEPAAEPAGDDLFGDEPSAAGDVDAGDDLFGEPAAEETPAAEEPAGDDDFDDLFNRLETPGGLRSNEFRLWTDNSGLFRTQGRLASVGDGFVRLALASGGTATVQLERLSATDLDFVYVQASLERAERISRTAMR